MKEEQVQKVKPGWMDYLVCWGSKPYLLIPALVFVLIPSHHLAGALESGADFLNIGVGARPVGMGSAYTALADDINAIYWNPAGLAGMAKKEIGAMHSEWLLDTKYEFVGFGLPTKKGTWGFGICGLGQGEFEGRGSNRESTGGFDASDQAFSIALGRQIGNGRKIGAGVKYIRSRIGQDSASTFALDFGLITALNILSYPVSLGVSVQNLGPGMKFINQRDPLPLSISGGLALGIMPGLNLALDVKRLVYDQKTTFGMGTECQILPVIALRAGYLSSGLDSGTRGLSGLVGGLGLKVFGTQLDYALVPFEYLGNTHRVSVKIQF